MSALVSTAGLWDADVTVGLTTHTKHRHVSSPVSAHFEAPGATPILTFGPIALAAAVARTATTRDAPAALLDGLQGSALAQLECLIADGPVFELSSHLDYLADTERTLFAARVGAGITDLYMNALGYAWRANAACLSKSLDPHADFIYDGGNASGHGVVLAEAHGSFAANTTGKSIAAQAKRKYARQVSPYIAQGSLYGKVVHGYSIAFGSKPGTTGAFLSLAETSIPKQSKKSAQLPPPMPSGRRLTPTPIALAAHRSNFLLMGARQVSDWIDWVRGVGELPANGDPVVFFRLSFAGRWYLGSALAIWSSLPPSWRFERFWDDPVLWPRIAHRAMSQAWTGGPALGWFAKRLLARRSSKR
jgi:hypothetical protein